MRRKIKEENESLAVVKADTEPAEQQWIVAAKAGDKNAFGRLIRAHQKRLFRFVYGLTGSFDQTEDIVQEAFVKAYSAIETFQPGKDFYPWLSTIARNYAFNVLQKDKKKESLDKIQEQGFDTPTDDLGPLEQLISTEGQKRFQQALKALPEKYRIVFVMRHYEDMNYEEIAGELKIPPGTVDSRLYRARQMLLASLKDLL